MNEKYKKIDFQEQIKRLRELNSGDYVLQLRHSVPDMGVWYANWVHISKAKEGYTP